MNLFIFIILLFLISCSTKNTEVVENENHSETSISKELNRSECASGDCNNGYGIKEYTDGGFEKGNWVNGELHGYGERFYGSTSNFSGDSYKGYLKHDFNHGYGTYTDVSEGVKLKGYHQDGKVLYDYCVVLDMNTDIAVLTKKIEWEELIDTNLKYKTVFPKVDDVQIVRSDSLLYGYRKQISWSMNCQTTDHINLAYSISTLDLRGDEIFLIESEGIHEYYKAVQEAFVSYTNSRIHHCEYLEFRNRPACKTVYYNPDKDVFITSMSMVKEEMEYRIGVFTRSIDSSNFLIPNFIYSFEFLD